MGTITTDVIMHSNVRATDEIIASGRKGLITGGTIISSKRITAKNVGSSMGSVTNLEIGLEPGRMDRYHELEKEIDFKLDEIDKMKQTIAVFQKMLKNKDKISPEKMKQMMETNELYKQYISDVESAREEKNAIMQALDACKKGRVYVHGNTCSGVVINIAGTIAKISTEAIHTCFIKEGADIRFSSF